MKKEFTERLESLFQSSLINKMKNTEYCVFKAILHNYTFPSSKGAHSSGGYCVVKMDVVEVLEGELPEEFYDHNRRVTVVGYTQRFDEGIEYIITGKPANDKKYGWQIQCESSRMAFEIKTIEDQKKFFSCFMTENQISMLFSQCDDPISLLKNRDLKGLTAVKGIGPATATRMCDRYEDNVPNSIALIKLKDYGLTKKAIDNIVRQLGSPDVAVDVINENPYRLIHLVRGYGWEKADKIAKAQGFTNDCKARCMAYTEYRLNKAADEEGNSKIDFDFLFSEVKAMCSPAEHLIEYWKEKTISEKSFDEEYKKFLNKKRTADSPIFYFEKGDTPNSPRYISLLTLRCTEKAIADQIKRLKNDGAKMNYDREKCSQMIKEVEEEQGYKYTDEQISAIWRALDSNVMILTGSSGTGKSSTLKPLIRIFKHYNKDIAQCALSGRASSLLTEYTGLEGKTIHRLLHYLPDEEKFANNENNPLTHDVIILDETSMVGEKLFFDLIKSIKSGAKLIMLGDIKQLPPMSVGNILSDCMKSGYIPMVQLTIIQRQAIRSGIVSESIKICQGKSLVGRNFNGEDVRGELRDLKIICDDSPAVVHKKAIDEFKKMISHGISCDDIQIIVPVRSKGINSCRCFNEDIQRIVSPEGCEKSVQIKVMDNGMQFFVDFRKGDRVMVTKNNYHAVNVRGTQTPIFNGNIGYIIDIDNDNMIISLGDGDTEKVIIPRENWYDISLSYACTCHKLQGSQAKYIIVVVDNGSFTMLSREWLYTAVTRGRKFCSLVGQASAISRCTSYSDLKEKTTWLKNDLKKMYFEEIK